TTSFQDIPTLEIWIRTTISSQSIIDSGATFGSWRIGIDNSGRATYAHFRNGTGGFITITGATVVTDDEDHHLVAQTDQSAKTIRLFVDGNLEASYTETAPSFTSWAFAASGDTKLGKSDTPGLPLSFYNGAADELTLYSRVLSTSEIQGLF